MQGSKTVWLLYWTICPEWSKFFCDRLIWLLFSFFTSATYKAHRLEKCASSWTTDEFSTQPGIYVGLRQACSGQLWLVCSCLNMEHCFTQKEHTRPAQCVSWKNNDYMILCCSQGNRYSLYSSPQISATSLWFQGFSVSIEGAEPRARCTSCP